MPQMAPLNWMTLFSCFNIILLICLIKIWFMNPTRNKPDSVPLSRDSKMPSNMSWKW